MMYCSWTTAECLSRKAVQLRCREPGYLGCYTRRSSSPPNSIIGSFIRHDVQSNAECVSICLERGNDTDVAVLHQGACVCVPSETFTVMSSSETTLHEWSCPTTAELKFRPALYYAFNVSYGFCDNLGIVQNGKWDSDITWFGSMVTLICDQGYFINGSPTLHCVGQPGRSSYSPIWNASVPSCRAIENTHEIRETAITVSLVMGLLLLTMFGIGFLRLFVKKRANNSRDHTPDAEIRSGRITPRSAHNSSRPLQDVKKQDGENVATVMKKLYVEKSGPEKKKKNEKDVTAALSSDTSGDEKGIEVVSESGYLIPSGGVRRVTCQLQGTRDTTEADDRERTPPCHRTTRVGRSSHSKAELCLKDVQPSNHQEIVSTSDQSVPIPEPQCLSKSTNISSVDKRIPLAMSSNAPFYSASIYSSNPLETPEVNQHGYLVFDANTSAITSDQPATFQEPQSRPEYTYIDGNEKRSALATRLNEPSYYSASIFSSKPRENRTVHENYCLVLEAAPDGILDDQFVNLPVTEISSETDLPTTKCFKADHKATLYESIHGDPEL